MMKLVLTQLKWAAGLIILVVAILLIGGCTPANQPRGGEATTQLTINVVAINHPPVIDSLTTERGRVNKAAVLNVECIASDPDGDELSYMWSADRGNISGNGPIAAWVAPNATGIYTITVTITDDRGREDSKSIDIKVCSCP